MRFLPCAAASVFIAALGGAECSTSTPPIWPENGVMKISGKASPGVVHWSLYDCFKVSIYKNEGYMRVINDVEDYPGIGESTFPVELKPDGSFVMLAKRQNGANHYVVTAEAIDGTFHSLTASSVSKACPLSSTLLNGTDNSTFNSVLIQHNKEITDVL